MMYIAVLKAKAKTAELLELVSLTNEAKKKIKTFSGGMKQRLGIAQAMLNDPKILVKVDNSESDFILIPDKSIEKIGAKSISGCFQQL